MKKRNWLDWVMLGVVVGVAGLVITASFHNTKIIASELNVNPILAASVVEIIFGVLLFLRGRQRATKRNVPLSLEIGYLVSFLLVTAVNVYGLAQESPIVGTVVGLAISGAMWLTESTLVWLWTESHLPHQKSIRDMKREAKVKIEEMKAIELIEWMKYEAQKPDMKLIQRARKVDEKRKKVVGDGLPEFFLLEPEPVPQILAEPVVVDVPKETEQVAEIIPLRTIGFHTEESKPAPRFEPNLEAREQAIQIAKALKEELGRLPKKKELKEKGLTDHYSRVALDVLTETEKA